MQTSMKAKTIILIGSQGSGKGTQALHLKGHLEKGQNTHKTFLFATGEGFRAFSKESGLTQNLVLESLQGGKILPVFLPVWLWTSLFIKHIKGDEHIIFDGSPRTRFEAEILETAFDFYAKEEVIVLNLVVSRDEILRRLTSRGRDDDTNEAIKERVSWYEDNIHPVLDFFRAQGRYRVVDIDGEQTPEGVFEDIKRSVE